MEMQIKISFTDTFTPDSMSKVNVCKKVVDEAGGKLESSERKTFIFQTVSSTGS